MSSKVNAACKSLSVRPRKDNSDIATKQQVQIPSNKRPKQSSPNDVLVIDNCGRTIEVTVTTKGRKSGSTMVSSGITNVPKTVEEKKIIGNVSDGYTNNWSKTLREQNRPVLKQGLQQLVGQIQSSKNTKHENVERKDVKTTIESQKSHKYTRNDNRMLDEIPIKQTARKSPEYMKTVTSFGVPSTTTIASSLESIEVKDRGVQCGGIFDCSNDRFSVFNPVRTLGFLMKEMEGLVNDERSSKILTEMEQALLRIPTEPGKPTQADLEAVVLHTKLEASTAQLESASKKMQSTCAKLREDKENLQQQVNKQSVMLQESQHRERNLEKAVQQMKMDLNEVLKSAAENRRIIAILKDENKNIEVSQKLASDLRRDLNEQIELAEQRYMEVQYLKLEREKLIALSSFKDSTLVELRKTLKDLQNHISEQLIDIREAGKRIKESSNNQELSVIHGGAACSSPTSTSSKNSLLSQSCHELSEMSLSMVDCLSNSAKRAETNASKNPLEFLCSNGLFDDSAIKRVTDKTQLEFISLPGGETSHTISLSQRKEEAAKIPISSADNKNDAAMGNERKLDEFHSAPNLGGKDTGDLINHVDKDNKHYRQKSKARKSSSSADKKQQNDDVRHLSNSENGKTPGVERCSGDPASIKEQFEIMFEDIRLQSKIPVHVPSPPRNYPRPDWSDSSLPTISGISESNIG